MNVAENKGGITTTSTDTDLFVSFIHQLLLCCLRGLKMVAGVSVQHFGPEGDISTCLDEVAIKIAVDIHHLQRANLMLHLFNSFIFVRLQPLKNILKLVYTLNRHMTDVVPRRAPL